MDEREPVTSTRQCLCKCSLGIRPKIGNEILLLTLVRPSVGMEDIVSFGRFQPLRWSGSEPGAPVR